MNPDTVDRTVRTVKANGGTLHPFTSETARAASLRAAEARKKKRAEEKAILAMAEAAAHGATVQHPAPEPVMVRGQARDAYRSVLRAVAKDPPWREGPEASHLIRTLAELAAQEDRDAEARRQRLLAESVKREPKPDAVEALVRALAATSPTGGASEPDAEADSAGAGADA